MTLVVLTGPLLLLVGVVLAGLRIIGIFRHGEGRWALRSLAVAIGIGLGGYLAGTFAGVWALCSSANAGNLCGLGGIFGIGPLASGALLIAYSRSRRMRPE